MEDAEAKILLGIAVFGIFVVVLLVFTTIGVLSPQSEPTTKNDTVIGQKTTKCNTILYPPIKDEGAFGKAIDDYIESTGNKNAPLYGLGKEAVLGGKKYGINPAYLINIARKESIFGKIVPSGSYNSFGRTATASQPHIVVGGRNWYKYDSWSQSLEGQSLYLKERYADKGLITVEQITPVYAPPSENNTTAYIKEMLDWIDKVIQKAGDAVTCS